VIHMFIQISAYFVDLDLMIVTIPRKILLNKHFTFTSELIRPPCDVHGGLIPACECKCCCSFLS
jgi:hypothetical protein